MSSQTALFDVSPWTPLGPMPKGTLEVARIIRAFCNGAWGYCAAFIETISRRLGRSARWIHERLSWLRKAGYLASKQQGRGRPAKYLCTSTFAELFAEQRRPILSMNSSENTSPKVESNPVKRFPQPDNEALASVAECFGGRKAATYSSPPSKNWASFVTPPPFQIENEYGRRSENPVYPIWRKVYERVRGYAASIRNPKAYYQKALRKAGL